MKLPKHKASLTIAHNEHKNGYKTVKELFGEWDGFDDDENPYSKDLFESDEDYQSCIETNELWEIRWYPDTPIGFYTVYASTLEKALAKANKIDQEDQST